MMILKRIAHNQHGTFGVLIDDSLIPFALTVERKWANNQKGVSCIPSGTYQCKRVNSPKFGDTFEVTGVPGREKILFHKGNIEDDSRGCIIVGEQFEVLNGKVAVLASAKGYGELMARLEGQGEFLLTIQEV